MPFKLKRGQAWSVDAMVGVFLFIIVIAAVVVFSVSRGQAGKVAELKEDGDKIFSQLSKDEEIAILNQKSVEVEKLEELTQLDYNALRNKLGIKNEFCIYFVDEEGHLVFIDENGNKVGIGSGRVLINNISCSH